MRSWMVESALTGIESTLALASVPATTPDHDNTDTVAVPLVQRLAGWCASLDQNFPLALLNDELRLLGEQQRQ